MSLVTKKTVKAHFRSNHHAYALAHTILFL